MAGGVTAQLSHGLLTLTGTSARAPIVVDIPATAAGRGVTGTVVVEGVGTYHVSQVR